MAEAKKTVKKKTSKVAKKKATKVAKPKPVKKVTKKAAKKTKPKATKVTKKAKSKKAAKKAKGINLGTYDIQNVTEENHFYFVNGHKVKNVKELAEVMDRIEQEIFDFHVNPDNKNDFYNWVRHVFDDLELAEKMVGVTGPKHLQFTIYKHVADKAMKKK